MAPASAPGVDSYLDLGRSVPTNALVAINLCSETGVLPGALQRYFPHRQSRSYLKSTFPEWPIMRDIRPRTITAAGYFYGLAFITGQCCE